jgi:CheY-like chemotaxis protein
MAHVLIVDDEEATVDLMSTVVSLFGHEPSTAYAGLEALDLIESEPPDVILLDLMMPDVDGLETLHRLRALPQGDGLPVIVITASAAADLDEQVAEAGGNACLRKPVEMDVLERLIADFCPDA